MRLAVPRHCQDRPDYFVSIVERFECQRLVSINCMKR